MSRLQDLLAEHLRRDPQLLVYRELPLGPNRDGTQRADVLTLGKSYHLRVRIYEVKAGRSDFRMSPLASSIP